VQNERVAIKVLHFKTQVSKQSTQVYWDIKGYTELTNARHLTTL